MALSIGRSVISSAWKIGAIVAREVARNPGAALNAIACYTITSSTVVAMRQYGEAARPMLTEALKDVLIHNVAIFVSENPSKAGEFLVMATNSYRILSLLGESNFGMLLWNADLAVHAVNTAVSALHFFKPDRQPRAYHRIHS